MKKAAGFLFQTEGCVLLLKRAEGTSEGGTWSIPGGRAQEDEEPLETAQRETFEEIGFVPSCEIQAISRCVFNNNQYVTIVCTVEEPFIPKLNWEHDDYIWICPKLALNNPDKINLHPGLSSLLKKMFG